MLEGNCSDQTHVILYTKLSEERASSVSAGVNSSTCREAASRVYPLSKESFIRFSRRRSSLEYRLNLRDPIWTCFGRIIPFSSQ